MGSFLRSFTLIGLCVIALLGVSCSWRKSDLTGFRLGEKVMVGKIYFQVLGAEWLPELPGSDARPRNRILQLHISMSNAGGTEVAVPYLHVIDGSGREIMEESRIEANPRWLGPLRRLQPALPEEGMIYFDVPVGAYKLELVDRSDPEDEKLAYVDIPASLAPPTMPSTGPI